MRSGAQKLLLGLRFGKDDEEINRQIAAHISDDFSADRVLDVIGAFAVLNAAGWPGAAKYFRLYVQVFPDLWITELSALPEVEKAVASVGTLQGLGMPLPCEVARVAAAAQRELTRRGFVFSEGAQDEPH